MGFESSLLHVTCSVSVTVSHNITFSQPRLLPSSHVVSPPPPHSAQPPEVAASLEKARDSRAWEGGPGGALELCRENRGEANDRSIFSLGNWTKIDINFQEFFISLSISDSEICREIHSVK